MRRDLSWIDAFDLLESLGIRNISRSGQEIDFSCPSGNHAHGDATPSARINSRTLLFVCHNPACGWRGDAVTFLARVKDLTESQALRVLSERYGGPERSVEEGGLLDAARRVMSEEESYDQDRVLPDESWLGRFLVNWSAPDPSPWASYMLGRGFDPMVLQHWQIGYDAASDRVTIPVRDSEGTLVGFKGRAWREDQSPKYLIVGDALGRVTRYGFSTYAKSEVVFGLDRLGTGASPAVVEGELNVLALDQVGVNAVAVAGAEFSESQARQIVERCHEVAVYFDADEAGRYGTEKVAEALSPYLRVYVVQDAPGDAAEVWEGARELIASAVPHLEARTLASIRRTC